MTGLIQAFSNAVPANRGGSQLSSCECRIHEDQTEAEACVNESLGVCFAKVPHSSTDVLSGLRNRLNTDDPNPAPCACFLEISNVGLSDQ